MLRKIFILIFILGCVNYASAQNSADSLFQLAKQLKSNKEIDSALDVSMASTQQYIENKDWLGLKEVLKFTTKLPYDTSRMGKFRDFISEQSALVKPINPIEAADLFSFVGAWNARNGKYEEAVIHYKKAADELYALQDTQYLHMVYYRLGQLMQLARSNPAEALVYAEQAERVSARKKYRPTDFEGKMHYLRGVAYRGLNNEKSIYHFRKAQDFNRERYGEIENFITKSLLDLERYEEAYASAKKASKKYTSVTGKENGELKIYEAIALDELGRHSQAIETIDIASRIIMNDYDPSNANYIKVFHYKAQLLAHAGELDEALDNCQKVYSLSIPYYTSLSNRDVPEIVDITPNQWVLETLIEHGKILVEKYKKTKEVKYLELALKTCQKSIQDIEYRRKMMNYWDSKEQYNRFLYRAYEQSLYISALLYQSKPTKEHQRTVLSFLEKSKATLLQEKYRSEIERKDIPKEILEEENGFIQAIAELETEALKEQSEGDVLKAKTLKNELFDIRLELEEFRQKHKSYYSVSHTKIDSVTSDEKMKMLPDETAVLAYQISKDHIIGAGFNSEEFYLEITPNNKDFNDKVIKMRESLSDWNSILSQRKKSEDQIKTQAKDISGTLLKLLGNFKNPVKHLIVMPEGILHNIPFELLPIPGSEELMIDQYDISYAYVFSSFPSIKKGALQKVSFAGFAPKYQMDLEEDIKESEIREDANWIALREGLIDIPEARKSVSKLAKRFDGASWLDDEATKSNFVQEAKNYDLLHLGMHSLVDENTSSLSSLVFSGKEDNELHLREIQSMNIPSALVVLSACNTGVGRNIVGEGPFSLARAFFYAGAQSTLMSLWKVPDLQTSQIMQLFYGNLEKGLDKSQALAKAKREYLVNASVLESHPAFWSGFVLVGDTSSLDLQPKQSFLFSQSKYLLTFLLLGLIIWWIWNRNRSK